MAAGGGNNSLPARVPPAGHRSRRNAEPGGVGRRVADILEKIDDLARLAAQYRAITGAGGDDEDRRNETGMPGQPRQAVRHAIEGTRKAAPPPGGLQQEDAVALDPFSTAALRSG